VCLIILLCCPLFDSFGWHVSNFGSLDNVSDGGILLKQFIILHYLFAVLDYK